MKRIISSILIIIAVLFLLLVSVQSLAAPNIINEQINLATLVATPEYDIQIAENGHIDDLPLVDNMDIYQFDDPGSIVYMYVTVRVGNSSDNSDHTWQEVQDFTKFYYHQMEHIVVGKAEAIIQIGDETGPLPDQIGYGEVIPNATIQIRGASASSGTPQKSFKIELRDRAGLWRGQGTIALNKHPWDPSRIRNKLSFDLLKDVPDVASLRTQFVRLYVRDETSDPPSEEFVDYGLFTQIEQPNKAYLRSRMLDQSAHFYKPNFFEFFRYEDDIQPIDSPNFDKDLFEGRLEIKGNNNHDKLIQMLEDVNDWSLPINQVLEHHFNEDNYFTWLAFNILVGNIDTQAQNFYLYSPLNSDTWYFIPWDYDSALSRQERDIFNKQPYENFELGVSNYWGTVLHNRVLRFPENREKLDKKINMLMEILTPEKISSLLNEYRPSIEPLLYQTPDIQYLRVSKENYNHLYELIPREIQLNYDLYHESLETPMPFYLGIPKIENDSIRFNWSEAYDFDAEDISYQFQLSTNWEFSEIIHEETIQQTLDVVIILPPAGTYFWRVIATNESGYSEYPFDYYKDAEGKQRAGMKYLYITTDGQVLENEVSP